MESLNLKNVSNELSAVRYKYKTIGVQLGIPYDKLQLFARGTDPFYAMIDYWLKRNVEGVTVSWESIVNALSSEQVAENGLAITIANKYGIQLKKGQEAGKFSYFLNID